MYTILDQQELLKTFYLPGAFLYSDSLIELAGTLKCLDAIDFKWVQSWCVTIMMFTVNWWRAKKYINKDSNKLR